MRHIYGTLFDNTGQPILRYFFLKLRPESKVTMTLNDIRHSVTPKICVQTKFGIPISNNIGFMLMTRFFLDLRAYVKVGYATLQDPKMHEFTSFGIPTSNNTGDMIPTYVNTETLSQN